MKLRSSAISLLAVVCFSQEIFAQQETYSIELAPFCSNKFDEFAPVHYKNGLVFSTNRITGVFNYSNANNQRFFHIYFIDTTRKTNTKIPVLFSKNLTTVLNDGPVTFNSAGDVIYFSRNVVVEGDFSELSSPGNKLGIFTAVYKDGEWGRITEFKYNSAWFNAGYNLTTPCLSPDGNRLYFASDKPDGFGGSDIYYCDRVDGDWAQPVNLGAIVNTGKNESYPYIGQAGELFFASDGHPGLGGKDIFVTRMEDSSWVKPVRLDPPINSKFDDFSIVADNTMTGGYFASNRGRSIDMYRFTSINHQILFARIQQENQYCFRFSDEMIPGFDSINLQYRWTFGDGHTEVGRSVVHCYRDPGFYTTKLDLVEPVSGMSFYTLKEFVFDLRKIEQAYIEMPRAAIKGASVELDGSESYLPGNSILNYSWEFGDGTRASGQKVIHSYAKEGQYLVKLELTLRPNAGGTLKKASVAKEIRIVASTAELPGNVSGNVPVSAVDLNKSGNVQIRNQFSAETQCKPDELFVVEIASSKNRMPLNSAAFNSVPAKYTLKEIYHSAEGSYSYTAERQEKLLFTYPAYRELVRMGFRNTRIRKITISDAAELELRSVLKTYGYTSENYFDRTDRLTSNAYIMLNQVVRLMNKYPAMRLEIAVHADNRDTETRNFSSSQRNAQQMADYLIARGINSRRIEARGLGATRPVTLNDSESDRKMNRRIDFTILSR